MKTGNIVLLVICGVIAITLLWGIGSYNGLVNSQEQVTKTWGDVQSTYQRRNDLIPNLVETVKGYATHESGVFTAVAEARAKVGQLHVSGDDLDPEKLKQFAQAQQGLGSALSRLMVVSENYPALKASEGFLNLQSQLEGTENRINVARERFNEATRTYNTSLRKFPTSLIANNFDFKVKPYFEAEEQAQSSPKVKF